MKVAQFISTFSDLKLQPVQQESFRLDLLTVNNYYAFGMNEPDRNYKATGLNKYYRYGYNGKERDNELKGESNSYDFGARLYDNRGIRWFSRDPLADKYPSLSSYCYVANNPINAIDPDGRLIIFVNGLRSKTLSGIPNLCSFDRESGGSSYDKTNYWGNFVNKATERIKDNNIYFFDGTNYTKSATDKLNFNPVTAIEDRSGFDERKENGRNDARILIGKIESGEVKMKSGETIKVFAHSMGYAHAEGMAEVLNKAGYKIEVLYAMAAEGAKFAEKPKGVGVLKQYMANRDLIVPYAKIKGNDEFTPINGGHSIDNFLQIFNINKGEEGYVEKRKDNSEDKKNKGKK